MSLSRDGNCPPLRLPDSAASSLFPFHATTAVSTTHHHQARFFSESLNSASPALEYKQCVKHKNIEQLVQQELSRFGLRRSTIIAKNLHTSLGYLEEGGWRDLIQNLETLQKHTTKNKERKVAAYLSDKSFPGLGPKQSRNFIQWLGLSRYEIPLDSRTTKTMKKLGCSFVPSASALSYIDIYLLVQDGLQEIASQLNIYPCILDACIFSSFDKNVA